MLHARGRTRRRRSHAAQEAVRRTGYPRGMRRIVVLPVVLAAGLAAGLLAGCSQVTQMAGDAVGIDVQATCTTIDDAYGQYQSLLDQGEVSAEQADAARDELVASLEGLAANVDGQLGDLIRSGATQIGGMTDLQAPETVEAIEQLKDSASAFCG